MAEERIYTIPIRKKIRDVSRGYRTRKAVRTVREFLQRHMKTEEVKLGDELNKFLWSRGIKKPPARVRVRVVVEEGVAKAELADVLEVPEVEEKIKEKVEGKPEEKKDVQKEEVSYEEILDAPVAEVKKRIEALENPDYGKLLELEKKGKN
ncbi:MAG: hypothetical protein DRP11_02945, partial [Candidatus Aenigmatarchaeota archaeon]